MGTKSRHIKSLTAIILATILLTGCDGGGGGGSGGEGGSGSTPEVPPPDTGGGTPNPEPPEPNPPEVTSKTGYLLMGGTQTITGAYCNNELSHGFTFIPGNSVTCRVGETTIATFNTQAETARHRSKVDKVAFNLEDAQEFIESEEKKNNALFLITLSDSCPADPVQICLTFDSSLDRMRFETLYKEIALPSNEFIKLVTEEVANNATTDKAPSSHTSVSVPVTTPGTTPDLNADFVSANAEQFYQYQPDKFLLTQGRLVDSQGHGIAGVSYYAKSGHSVTGTNGAFSFNWGETVSFGIDTFELGSVRANKSIITLVEVGDEVRGTNIEQLVNRYSKTGQQNERVIPEDVAQVFSKYPNVINEIINLSLSSGTTLDTGDNIITLPNEFIAQFSSGQAKEIDTEICAEIGGCNPPQTLTQRTRTADEDSILSIINKLWGVDVEYKSVNTFHVFHDSQNYYGSTGSARGQAGLNISNTAFPILMARNDKNYWLAFGDKKAWDKDELAYITEAPSIEQPENVNSDSATFNLPFISMGQAGQGKLMLVGNPHYNSILRCPNGYSWDGGVTKEGQCTLTSDSDDMKHFMQNVLRYMSNERWLPDADTNMTVGTNLENVYFKRGGLVTGNIASFGFHPDFSGITAQPISSYSDLDPTEVPLLILNGFEYFTEMNGNFAEIPLRADTTRPKLTQQNVTDVIAYMNRGGSVLIMENVMSTLTEESASDFVRLLDAAGLSMALNSSVVKSDPQGYPNVVRQRRGEAIWVYERYPVIEGELPYTIDEATGEVIWKYQTDNKPDDKPEPEVGSWLEEVEGTQVTHYAFIDEAEHLTQDSLDAAKARIFSAFPGLQECTDPAYEYEVNCLERRSGTGVPVTGTMYVPRFTQLNLSADTASAMVQAADLGTNIQRLYQHELYFRTSAREGIRLNSVDLERLYQNMSVWLWNDEVYRYEPGQEDELGFKTFTEFLNCYANDAYSEGTLCSEQLKTSLADHNMVYGEGSGKPAGMMNPGYPLNYMEKPLTRLMLGRAWWDLNIRVDTEHYPGGVTAGGETVTKDISLYSSPTSWFAGNMQSTGLWAPAHQEVSIQSTASAPVTVTVALGDDLTGLEKHEVGLKRPPRVTKSYSLEANGSVSFRTPYGGLIYISGNSAENLSASFTFTGVVKAPFYKNGGWEHELNSPAPFGEVETKSFVYTTPKRNLEASNFAQGIEQFAGELDAFADAMHDFYARDGQSGEHRMFTYAALPGHKHRFVNDVQISIGSAHSGYPVMNSSFSSDSTSLPTTPLDDWLLWHEVGHNAAESPLVVSGATEVANNVLALYMQDRYLGKMNNVSDIIAAAPEYLNESNGQAWGRGGADDRLLMFAQLKEWAEQHVDVAKWYPEGATLPAYYSQREGLKGWNLFQLMHRKARGDDVGEAQFGTRNYCAESNGNPADTLMLCASWVAQADLSAFFKSWNPGANAYQLPGGADISFEGGVSDAAYATLAGLNLKKPEKGPEAINQVTEYQLNSH